MADSNRLNDVARDNGFRERTKFFLAKKAVAVINEATPDANELSLAKTLLYPADTNNASFEGITDQFAQGVVTVTVVANALIAADFQHTAFTDTDFETQVNIFWSTYAKSIV